MTDAPQSASSRPLSISIVAAEESGDALGAALARALIVHEGGTLKLSGIGGRAMALAGITSPFAIDDLSIIGLTAIPQRLPTILRRIREASAAVVSARPDVLVIVDSPDFTHRVARKVRRLARLRRSSARYLAIRAGGPSAARRSALRLCWASAD